MSFGPILFGAMASYGDRPAMVSHREALTYAQTLAQVDNLSANLAAFGVKRGDRVGVAVQDSLETTLSILACWRLSATPAIIDFRAPRAQRARMAHDFMLAPVIESRSPPGEETYPSLIFDREWRYRPRPEYGAGEQVDGSNPAFLMFSSGTTGDPKAYIQTHETLKGRTGGRVAPTATGEPPRYLTAMTLTYSATRHHVLSYLLAGGVVRFFPPLFTPSEIIEGLLAFGATGTSHPPSVIARMVREAGERAEVLFPALHTLDSMGGPARAEDKVAAWHNLSHGYRIGYSSSLTGRISMLAGEDVLARPESAGRLIDGVRVDILDEEGRSLPPGEAGVIRAWTKGPASLILLPGSKPFVDPKVIGPGWGIPGDIGFLSEDGFLTLVDRVEDMIVRGGVNVAPQELEKLIRAHPRVSEVAVAGFPHDVHGQEIAAFVVSETGLSIDELRGFLNANVPPDRRPRELRLVASLPYNGNGKLLRRVLVEQLMKEAGFS
jgi:long-chain acyl-CoA synthetase